MCIIFFRELHLGVPLGTVFIYLINIEELRFEGVFEGLNFRGSARVALTRLDPSGYIKFDTWQAGMCSHVYHFAKKNLDPCEVVN